jgi:hypothetical protein
MVSRLTVSWEKVNRLAGDIVKSSSSEQDGKRNAINAIDKKT